MLISFVAFLSVCIFFVSLPLSLAAVVMGHLGYSAVQKNRPYLDGGWQAVTGLCVGYMAMVLSLAIGAFFLFGPDLTSDSGNNGGATFAERSKGIHEGGSQFSAKRALDNAESKIVSKQGGAAGRGNNPEAVELANLFAEQLKRIGDESFTSSRKPILQLSGGEYLTYCELHEDRCLFLVHVPSYRNFTDEAKKTLAELAWATAQLVVVDMLPPGTKLGVGLRGTLLYGDIMLGVSSTSSETLTRYEPGEQDDLLTFFVEDKPSISVGSDASSEEETGLAAKAAEEDSNPFENNTVGPGTDLSSMPERDRTNPTKDMPIAGEKEEPSRSSPSISREPEFENKIPIKLLTTIENKSWAFNSLAFSHDGRWIAAGKLDATLWVFNAKTGKAVAELSRIDKAQQVTSVAFSYQDEYLAAGGATGALFSWNVFANGQLKEQQNVHSGNGELQSLVASPSFNYLAFGDRQGKIVWCPIRDAEGKARELSVFEKKIQALWLPIKGVEAFGTDGQSICKFSLKSGEVLDTKKLEIEYPQLSTFSGDGKKLYVTDYNNLHIVETDSPNPGSGKIAIPLKESAHSLTLHPNQKWLATGFQKRTAIWDLEAKEIVAYVASQEIFNDDYVVFSNDGKRLAIASNSSLQPIRIYEVGEMQP